MSFLNPTYQVDVPQMTIRLEFLVICKGRKTAAAILYLLDWWTGCLVSTWRLANNSMEVPPPEELWLKGNSVSHINEWLAGAFSERNIGAELRWLEGDGLIESRQAPNRDRTKEYRILAGECNERFANIGPDDTAPYVGVTKARQLQIRNASVNSHSAKLPDGNSRPEASQSAKLPDGETLAGSQSAKLPIGETLAGSQSAILPIASGNFAECHQAILPDDLCQINKRDTHTDPEGESVCEKSLSAQQEPVSAIAKKSATGKQSNPGLDPFPDGESSDPPQDEMNQFHDACESAWPGLIARDSDLAKAVWHGPGRNDFTELALLGARLTIEQLPAFAQGVMKSSPHACRSWLRNRLNKFAGAGCPGAAGALEDALLLARAHLAAAAAASELAAASALPLDAPAVLPPPPPESLSTLIAPLYENQEAEGWQARAVRTGLISHLYQQGFSTQQIREQLLRDLRDRAVAYPAAYLVLTQQLKMKHGEVAAELNSVLLSGGDYGAIGKNYAKIASTGGNTGNYNCEDALLPTEGSAVSAILSSQESLKNV